MALGGQAVPWIERELQGGFRADWIEILAKIGEPAVPVLAKGVSRGGDLVIE